MGIFSRLGTLIKSNLNDLISKAEDPQKMLNQIVVEMQNQLVEAKKQVAVSIADEKRLKKNWDEQVELSKEWERKAMLAVRSGDDALAKEALLRKGDRDKQQLAVRSEASVELGGELAGDTLQQKFKKLEGATGGGSDLALAELKAKMGLGPMPDARPALTSGGEESTSGTGGAGASRADKS